MNASEVPASAAPKTKIWLSAWLSFMLILVAGLHTIESNTAYSPKNELVLIEFTLLMIVVLIGISNLVSSLYYLLSNNKEDLQPSLLSFFIAVSALTIAIILDAETLLQIN